MTQCAAGEKDDKRRTKRLSSTMRKKTHEKTKSKKRQGDADWKKNKENGNRQKNGIVKLKKMDSRGKGAQRKKRGKINPRFSPFLSLSSYSNHESRSNPDVGSLVSLSIFCMYL